jgi:hypothetical protein
VKVEERDGDVVLTFCRIVPEREAWLWENDRAIAMVKRGLDEAARGEITEGPDLAAAFAFAEDIPDQAE